MNHSSHSTELMENRFRELTGNKDISPEISSKLQTLAAHSAEMLSSIHELKKQAYPETATGTYLNLYARIYGIIGQEGESEDSLRSRLLAAKALCK